MRVAVPRESHPDETRVALVPETASRLASQGFTLGVEPGAGERAGFPDRDYLAAGARLVADPRELWGGADCVVKVREPWVAAPADEVALLPPGSTFVS